MVMLAAPCPCTAQGGGVSGHWDTLMRWDNLPQAQWPLSSPPPCQPGSLGKSQLFFGACKSHTSNSSTTQHWQSNLWPWCGSAQSWGPLGEPNICQCWWHGTCSQPTGCSWPVPSAASWEWGSRGQIPKGQIKAAGGCQGEGR